jgi:hypothetical protein
MGKDEQLQSIAVHKTVAPMNTDSPRIIRTVYCREKLEQGQPQHILAPTHTDTYVDHV